MYAIILILAPNFQHPFCRIFKKYEFEHGRIVPVLKCWHVSFEQINFNYPQQIV